MRVLLSVVSGVAVLAASTAATAQQLVYTPINPSFGGNPFNSSHLLGIAAIENQFKPATTTYTAPTQAEQFASQLQSTILAGVILPRKSGRG